MIIEGSLGVVRLELEWSVGEKEGRIVVSGTGQWRSCFFMASPELPKGLSILESSPRRGSAEFFGGSRKPGFSRPRDNWGAVIGWVRGFLGQFYRVAVTLLGRHTPFSELRNQHHHLEIASRRHCVMRNISPSG